ncbi:hypothetical protein Emed_001422 [Eimeria media]
MVLSDLLSARDSSGDGLLQLPYPVYLTHALLLSYAETKALDLRRLPLHRFASRLRPDQVAELPLSSVGGPRPFHMFVLFTFVQGLTDAVAEGLSSQCKDCPDALAAFRKAATAFKRSDASAAHRDKLPVFFAVINVGTREGAAISAIHPALQLPAVMHLPPKPALYLKADDAFQENTGAGAMHASESSAATTSSVLETTYRIKAAEFFARSLGDELDEQTELQQITLKQKAAGTHGKSHLLLLQRRKNEASLEERLLHWANNRTNRDVSYLSPEASPKTSTGLRMLLAFLPLLAAALGWLAWKMIAWVREKRWIIVVGGVAAYTLCSSGLVFSIIHSVPIAGFDVVTRRYVFIAATSRMQYLAEGLLLSCCSTIASLAALGLVRSSRFYAGSSQKVFMTQEEEESSEESYPGDDTDWREAEGGMKWRRYFAQSELVCTHLLARS